MLAIKYILMVAGVLLLAGAVAITIYDLVEVGSKRRALAR